MVLQVHSFCADNVFEALSVARHDQAEMISPCGLFAPQGLHRLAFDQQHVHTMCRYRRELHLMCTPSPPLSVPAALLETLELALSWYATASACIM